MMHSLTEGPRTGAEANEPSAMVKASRSFQQSDSATTKPADRGNGKRENAATAGKMPHLRAARDRVVAHMVDDRLTALNPVAGNRGTALAAVVSRFRDPFRHIEARTMDEAPPLTDPAPAVMDPARRAGPPSRRAIDATAPLPARTCCAAAQRVVVVSGHPRSPSLCGSLAQAYADGARAAGLEVTLLNLAELDFDPDVRTISPREQTLEPDLARAWLTIDAADHLVFVYPAWWGVGPARLKGFLDRILLPSIAFRERADGTFEGLMQRKTAHLLTTIDMPVWVYRLVYRAPGHNAMSRSTLGFCGVTTTRILCFGPVRSSTTEERRHWLERARRLGFSLRSGPRTASAIVAARLLAWLRALRLQFYAMPWVVYTVAALAAAGAATPTSGGSGAGLDLPAYLAGYGLLFFAEAATVFANDRFDFDSDRRNTNHGPFTGGSRVLVNGSLSPRALDTGIVVALMAALACAGFVLGQMADPAAASLLLAVLLVLGLGYTMPPLRLSWRGLGEVTVGITHSACVALWGWLLQAGHWQDPFPWLLSVPLFLGILPAITLSAIPDLDADRAAGKRTLAVRFGARGALWIALATTLAAAASAVPLAHADALRPAYANLLVFVLPHALLLAVLIGRQLARGVHCTRIDGLMLAALSFVIWFGAVPLVNLM